MGGMILVKRTIGFQTEAVPYNGQTLTVADYNLSAYDINYDPQIQEYARKLARGDYSKDVSVMGKRSIKITFKTDMAWSGTINVPPIYAKCLKACGFKETIYGATGVGYTPHADYSNIPATIEIVERDEGASANQVVIRAIGCMGTVKLVTNQIGEPKHMEWEFTGVLDSIADRTFASILTPTGLSTYLPEAILACTTSLFGESQMFNKITIDVGNKVELWTDPTKASGYSGARIVDRDATIDMDPALALVATNGQFSRETQNITGAYSESVGQHITIRAPQAQIIQAYKPGEREGRVTNSIKCRLTRDTNGNDELEILQGAKS